MSLLGSGPSRGRWPASIRTTGAALRPAATSAARRLRLDTGASALLKRAGLQRAPAPGPDAPASEADVFAAYRLLLGREPDAEGLAGYRRRLGRLGRQELAAELLGSVEFARRHPGAASPLDQPVAVEGFTIVVDPADWAVGATITATGRYEPEVTAVVRSLLRPGATFVDIGANIGWFSLLAASIVGPAGSVLAVEPNLRNCELLEGSKKQNGFSQIDVLPGAASDRQGWLALQTDASNGRVVPLGPVSGATAAIPCSYVVPAFPLDQLLAERGLDQVDAIKVDVEGVETAVFAGAQRLLSDRRTSVVFEWYPDALRSTGGVAPEAPLRRLRDLGYAIEVIGAGGPDLSDRDVEAIRIASGRENLDLLARPRS
ncbi:MAG: FkbM family methyltransferase [Acidimicrobiaceae bacterium]|nr:FkbM family methyltransferase [Acidimicrobiaceae bacterium]